MATEVQVSAVNMGATSSSLPKIIGYKTADTFAEVSGANYFLKVINQIEDGDLLWLVASDQKSLYHIGKVAGVITLTEVGGGSLSGAVILNSVALENEPIAHTVGGTFNPDPLLGNYVKVAVSANFTLGKPTAAGVPAVANTTYKMTVDITIDGTGGYVTDILDADFTMVGLEPVIANGANARTIIEIQSHDQGVTWEVVGDALLTDLPLVLPVDGDFLLGSDTSDSGKWKRFNARGPLSKTIVTADPAGAAQTPDIETAQSYYYNLSAALAINAATTVPATGKTVIDFEIEANGTHDATFNADYDFGDATPTAMSTLTDGQRKRYIGVSRNSNPFDMFELPGIF